MSSWNLRLISCFEHEKKITLRAADLTGLISRAHIILMGFSYTAALYNLAFKLSIMGSMSKLEETVTKLGL